MENENEKKNGKHPGAMIDDGVLAYGVNVGRFEFEEEGYTVYAVSDLPHIAASDCLMIYQITKEDYEKLLAMSGNHEIPRPAVPASVTDACHKEFLCGESVYCKRYYCTINDVDLSIAEKHKKPSVSDTKANAVMKYCPDCGKKNDGGKYCTDCGRKL